MTNSDQIKENVEIGKVVREIINLAMSEVAAFRCKDRFWLTLIAQIRAMTHLTEEEKPKPIEELPMTIDEAKVFGKQIMTFGQHQGKQIDQVPIDYLDFIADTTPFYKNLRRYLKSDRIKRERITEEVVDV